MWKLSCLHGADRPHGFNLKLGCGSVGPATGCRKANANSTTERQLGSRAPACHLDGSTCNCRGL